MKIRAQKRTRKVPDDPAGPSMTQHDPVAGLLPHPLPTCLDEHVAVDRKLQFRREQRLDPALQLAPWLAGRPCITGHDRS